MNHTLLYSVLVWLLLGTSGCSHNATVVETPPASVPAREQAIEVRADQAWTDTGVEVFAGEVVTTLAKGTIVAKCSDKWGHGQQIEVGPTGTYLVNDAIANQAFPMPSGARGPAPCFALIGRIGHDGPAIFLGERKSWVAKRSGRLKLGINDFDVAENHGQFLVEVSKPSALQPIAYEQIVPRKNTGGSPIPNCSVVVFYLDGLRPDVVREMAALGHIPTIKDMFIDGGCWLSNTFTVFPSDTITSNGTMWTGCFSDRHGLKGQVRFSRAQLTSESYLEPLGPNRSARLLNPQGIDLLLQRAQTASRRLFQDEDESRRWQQSRTTDIPPIYQHLRSQGADWSTGILPLMTEVPPMLWTRSIARHLPYFQIHNAWQYIDDANTTYAVRHLLQRRNPLTIIWLPETDSVSHKQCRGQFGLTRRTIAQADRLIKRMVDEVHAQNRLESTYFFLLSDHGHHGGRDAHLSHFDVADEVFFRSREVTRDGRWIGGGLGLSVRQHRYENCHQGDSRRQFVFVDGDSDGAARIFLPRGHYRSGDWMAPNRPGDLLAYRISDHLPPVNMLESLTGTQVVYADGTARYPIDLVLMKLAIDSILVSTVDRGQAVIERRRHADGRWLYRYRPVTDVTRAPDGSVAYRVLESPRVDPLGLLKHILPARLNAFYDERTWLEGTAASEYPDSVVALTRHMLWQQNLQVREQEYAPDLVITARPGWYFGDKNTPGTTHGYPLASSMRASWFISGPNVRRGASVDEPCRLADLTPTILDIIGVPINKNDFDGRPIRSFYNSEEPVVQVSAHPVYWQDVDLRAWKSLDYQPLKANPHAPFTVNRPDSAFDLNNAVYNVMSIGDLSVFRLFDDVLFPLTDDGRYVTQAVERTDQRLRSSRLPWVAEGVSAINLAGLSIGDYSLTSLGNMQRTDGLIDWIQRRGAELDRTLAKPIGRKHLPGTRIVTKTIDTTQSGFWEVYRFAQRIIIQVVDETVLNGIENGVDRTVNSFRKLPAEVIVEPSPSFNAKP